jgi:Pyruvate/2-oxoacid:ferredoxin oxidoreductase gamma subunit
MQRERLSTIQDLFSLAASVDENSIPVNLQSLAKEAGGAIMANTVASGALLALIGLDTSIMEQLLGETFSNKAGSG